MVNVDLYLEPDAGSSATISETVDYDFLRREIAALTAATFTCRGPLRKSWRSAWPGGGGGGAVSCEKPDVYPDCESIGFGYRTK